MTDVEAPEVLQPRHPKRRGGRRGPGVRLRWRSLKRRRCSSRAILRGEEDSGRECGLKHRGPSRCSPSAADLLPPRDPVKMKNPCLLFRSGSVDDAIFLDHNPQMLWLASMNSSRDLFPTSIFFLCYASRSVNGYFIFCILSWISSVVFLSVCCIKQTKANYRLGSWCKLIVSWYADPSLRAKSSLSYRLGSLRCKLALVS